MQRKTVKTLRIIPLKSEELITRKIAGVTILVPLKQANLKGQYIYCLEGIGGDIWELINGERDINEIIKILLRKYEVEKKQIGKEVRDFLTQLNAIGGLINGKLS